MSARRILTFSLVALAVYCALMAAWPLVREGYARRYRIAANGLFAKGASKEVRFQASPSSTEAFARDTTATHDTELIISDAQARLRRSTFISSRRHAYMPTALTLSLVLATPIPWQRRLQAAFWAMLLVHAYIALGVLAMPMAYAIQYAEPATGVRWFAQAFAVRYFWVISGSSFGWAIAPVALWLLTVGAQQALNFSWREGSKTSRAQPAAGRPED